jgi:Insertion element 4 transposase N-terminal
VPSYLVPSPAATAGEGVVPGGGALMVAVRLADLVSPAGRLVGEGDRSALAVGGTEKIRTGDQVVFLKVVAVAPARVRRDGRVQALGSPCDHATLGPLEEWLEQQAGPGVIDGIANRAALRQEYVKGTRKRLLTRAFVIRAVALMTLMPDADAREVVIALAGDLAMVPWARAWRPASPRALGDWRAALGPEPLEELQAIVLEASHAEHEERDWRAVVIGRLRPLKASAADGTLIRVPDTPANRAAFGSVGTGDDSAPFPQLRALPLTDASTRGLLGMPHGPAGTDKAAAEQKLLDAALQKYPRLFTTDRIWILDRNFPGAARIARLMARTHVLIRLKSDIPLRRTSQIFTDGSYIAEITGDGVTVTVRVIEYFTDVEGQDVPEMFCLVTDLLDWHEYPARDLAALYKWRWDGSETALRETKSSLRGAGPGTGPMLRSQTPGMVAQELAAWAAAAEMTRGVGRAAALAAVPARKGRRAGQPVQPREISYTAARRAVIAAIRRGMASYTAVTSAIGRYRTIIDRNRHRARKAKSPSTFPHAGPGGTATRIAEAVITIANTPCLTTQDTGITPAAAPAGPWNRPSPGTTRRPSACPETTRYAA